MKKTIKRTISMLIVLTLTVSMTIPAFASEADDPTGRCRAAHVGEIHISK